MKKLLILMAGLFFYFASCNAQTTVPAKPCTSPESSQFDFWIGNWKLTYNDTVHASNTVTKNLDGCVTYEHFSDPSTKFNGNSWSVYNVKTKKWQQTWVDNQGGYIVLSGSFENGKMELYTEPFTLNGTKVQQRMVYYNITSKNFDWNWEQTRDEGKTWKTNWKIHYERIK